MLKGILLDKVVEAAEMETLRKPLGASLEIFELMAPGEMTPIDTLVLLNDLEKRLLTEFKKLLMIEFEVATNMTY